MAYEDLLSIYRENLNDSARYEYEEPTECPNDGTTLVKREDGILFCRFDGWSWNGFSIGSDV